MDIHCYRSTVRTRTGANEYRYYRGNEQIGEAEAEVSSTFPVTVTGAGMTLNCSQDPSRTVFRGCSNVIRLNGGPQEYARVVYLESGVHSLELSYDRLRVIAGEGTYRFFRDGQPVAVMRRATPDSGPQRFWDSRWEPQMVMMATEPLPDPLVLLMMSVPLLQIGT